MLIVWGIDSDPSVCVLYHTCDANTFQRTLTHTHFTRRLNVCLSLINKNTNKRWHDRQCNEKRAKQCSTLKFINPGLCAVLFERSNGYCCRFSPAFRCRSLSLSVCMFVRQLFFCLFVAEFIVLCHSYFATVQPFSRWAVHSSCTLCIALVFQV